MTNPTTQRAIKMIGPTTYKTAMPSSVNWSFLCMVIGVVRVGTQIFTVVAT